MCKGRSENSDESGAGPQYNVLTIMYKTDLVNLKNPMKVICEGIQNGSPNLAVSNNAGGGACGCQHGRGNGQQQQQQQQPSNQYQMANSGGRANEGSPCCGSGNSPPQANANASGNKCDANQKLAKPISSGGNNNGCGCAHRNGNGNTSQNGQCQGHGHGVGNSNGNGNRCGQNPNQGNNSGSNKCGTTQNQSSGNSYGCGQNNPSGPNSTPGGCGPNPLTNGNQKGQMAIFGRNGLGECKQPEPSNASKPCGVAICCASDPKAPKQASCEIQDLCVSCKPPNYCCPAKVYYPQPKCQRQEDNKHCPPFQWNGTDQYCPLCGGSNPKFSHLV